MVFHLFFIFCFFNTNSILIVWIMLEVNLMLFINFVFSNYGNFKEKMNFYVSESSFIYFIFQSIFSFFILINVFNFNYMILINENLYPDILMVLALLGKMGLFPFSIWIYEMSKICNSESFIMLSTLQKLPIFIICSAFYNDFLFMFLLINFFIGSIYLFYSDNMKFLLVSSSIYNSFWFVSILFFNFFYFILFFIFYSLNFFLAYFFRVLSFSMFYYNYFMNFLLIFIMMSLINSPPFGLFFIKFYSIYEMINFMSLFICLLMLFFMISVFGYVKFFFNSIFIINNVYFLEFFYNDSKKFFFFFMFFSFLFFL